MFFCKICLFRSSYTIYSILVAYETRLAANGKPLEPKPVRTCSLRRKLTFTLILFVLPVDLSK